MLVKPDHVSFRAWSSPGLLYLLRLMGVVSCRLSLDVVQKKLPPKPYSIRPRYDLFPKIIVTQGCISNTSFFMVKQKSAWWFGSSIVRRYPRFVWKLIWLTSQVLHFFGTKKGVLVTYWFLMIHNICPCLLSWCGVILPWHSDLLYFFAMLFLALVLGGLWWGRHLIILTEVEVQ